MRPKELLAIALAALLSASVHAPHAEAKELDIRIRGSNAKGPIPRKSARGQSDTIGIVGEGAGETEFTTVNEIAEAVTSGQEAGPNGELGLRVLALPGRGGLQNVRDVLGRSDIDFGIAPALVLEKAAAMPSMANLRDRIAYVAPLYIEEVHLLVGPSVRSIEELSGKRVSLGEEGGSTEVVAGAVLEGLGVKVVAANLDARASVSAIRDGSVDAAFVVSGKPVQGLLDIAGDGKVRLLPVPAERVPEGFLPSVVTHEDYPGLVPAGSRVETLGVQNVLFGYDWPAKSPRGRVGRTFLSILMYRLPDLQVGHRHPKWREINVAAVMPGWKRLPVMADWLSNARPRALGTATEAEFDAFLKRTATRVTGENREALYQDFLRWRSSPVAVGSR
jgi:TRAP-type uncharacterized transport system substrate-binding protein